MDPIRILLGTLPHLLSDIVIAAIREQSDMVIVGAHDNAELPAALEQTRVDVVVTVVENDELLKLGRRVLKHAPHLSILALTDAAHNITLCEMRPTVVPLHEVSRQSLISAIRDVRPCP